jgi:DNA-binding SARP family transcriptional activator
LFVRLFGEVGAGQDAATVRIAPGVVAQAVLAVLALKGGRLVTLDQLADAVWEERPASWRNALQVAVSRLREHLDRTLVVTVSDGYRLDAALTRVDALEADDLLAEARRKSAMPRWPEALSASESLLELAADPALVGLSGAWADEVRSRVDEQVSEARLLRARALSALARFPEAIVELTRLVRERPLDESSATALMEALAAGGRGPEALEVYDALRRRLSDELGVDPAPQTQSAFLTILSPKPPRPFIPARVVRLPRLPGPTFGRDDVIATIVGSFESGYPVVTIVGAGGMGKTRVGIAAARRLAEIQSRSAWFVDLTTASDAADIEAALDASIDPNNSDHKVVLATGTHLILLDNAEHLIATTVANVVDDLLGCGETIILVTSRVPLQLATERLVWLSELAHDDPDSPAVRLLVDRAATWLTPSDVDSPVLAELAARADGVPLALELLAAALRWQTPAELLANFAAALRTPQRDGDRADRHLSVTAAIEWNLARADAATRRGLGALLVALGDFPLGAAEAVLEAVVPDRPARELLTALIDLSLLQRVAGAGAIRLRVLEPVRLAASGHPLVPPADNAARTACANYFLDLVVSAVDALDTNETAALALHLHDDHNLTQALGWLQDTDPDRALVGFGHVMEYWRWTGRTELIDSWASRLMSDPSCDSPEWARCAVSAARSFTERARPDQAAELRPLVERHISQLDHRWQFQWTLTESEIRRFRNDPAGAEAVLDHAPAPRTAREGSSYAAARAVVAAFVGDMERAARLTDEILREALNADRPSASVMHLANRAYFAIASSDFAYAERLLGEASALALVSGLREDFMQSNNNTAWLRLSQGRPEEALAIIRASAESLGRLDDLLWGVETVLIGALACEACGLRESCGRVVGLLRALLDDAPPALLDPWAGERADELLRRWPDSRGSSLRFEELTAELGRACSEAKVTAG